MRSVARGGLAAVVRPPHSSFICKIICKMKYLVCAAALAASLATAQAGGAVELSKDNFEAEIAGKNGFIKFLAPVSSIPLPGFARGINSPRVRCNADSLGLLRALTSFLPQHWWFHSHTILVSFSILEISVVRTLQIHEAW